MDIHGFGSWSYGRTTANNFLDGTPDGDYRHVSMSLSLAKQINDKLSLHGQVWIQDGGATTETELDFAFADYKLNDQLSFRIGQVKHPFGIYTELFDVGTLRPFIDLPQGFYGPVGFAGESYKGIGLSGARDVSAWTIAYDAYFGGTDLQKLAVPELYLREAALVVDAEGVEKHSTRNVVGGRLVFQTPIRGLSFGGSSYSGTLDEPAANRRTVFAGQIGYRTNTLTLESEVAHHDQVKDERATGGYVLAAYRLTPEWQAAAQYNALRNDFFGTNPNTGASLRDHRDAAFAINRWMSRSLVIKAEYHRVSGNRFALPDPKALASIIAASELRTTTHLVKFGAQFAY